MIRKQWLLPQTGSASIFKLVDIETESLSPLGPEEVLIKVFYSGINFADLHMRLGLYPEAPPFPFVPGYEVSGTVEKVGEKVTQFKVGDPVISALQFQGYSSNVKAPQEMVTALPKNFNLAEGAATVVSFLTAFAAIFTYGNIQTGMRLLVDCGSGSLGSMVCQLANSRKVEIVGLTSSPAKKNLMEARGARAFTHEEFKKLPTAFFDIIINSRGGASVAENFERLSAGGQLILIGNSHLISQGHQNWFQCLLEPFGRKYSASDLLLSGRGLRGLNLNSFYGKNSNLGKDLQQIHNFSIKPVVDRVFPYQELAQAHEYLERKESAGKVLIQWPN